jgi:Tfp pilus assembly protein PilP
MIAILCLLVLAMTDISAQDAKKDLRVHSIEEPTSEYIYSPKGGRDPFRAPLESVARETDKKNKRLSFLQDFSTDQIKLLGVLVTDGERKAVLRAPNNRSKTVQLGHPIGASNGYVVAINKEGIRVKEFTYLSNGKKKERIIEIKMNNEQEEASNAAAPPPEPSSDVFRKVYDQLRRQGKDIDELDSQFKEVVK